MSHPVIFFPSGLIHPSFSGLFVEEFALIFPMVERMSSWHHLHWAHLKLHTEALEVPGDEQKRSESFTLGMWPWNLLCLCFDNSFLPLPVIIDARVHIGWLWVFIPPPYLPLTAGRMIIAAEAVRSGLFLVGYMRTVRGILHFCCQESSGIAAGV